MPFTAVAAKQLLVGSFDATSTATGVDWGVEAESIDISTLADNSFRRFTLGERTLGITFPGLNDYAALAWSDWARTNLPSEQVVSLAYNGTTVGSPVVAARGLLKNHQAFNAQAGQVPALNIEVPGSSTIGGFEGLLTQASTSTITATGTSTAVQAGALASTQTVAAAIHILSFGGTGTLTFQLSSSATAGGAYTTRGSASAAVSAAGGLWLSASGLTVTDTWWRLAITASATPAVVAVASIGIITP